MVSRGKTARGGEISRPGEEEALGVGEEEGDGYEALALVLA